MDALVEPLRRMVAAAAADHVVVFGAGHLRGPPLLSVFDITLKTTS